MKEVLFEDIVIYALFLICAIIPLVIAIFLGKVMLIVLGIIGYMFWIILTAKAIIKYVKWKRGE